MPQVKEVRANIETHPAFGEALEEAKAAGFKIMELYAALFEEPLCFLSIVTLLGAENLDIPVFPLSQISYKWPVWILGVAVTNPLSWPAG